MVCFFLCCSQFLLLSFRGWVPIESTTTGDQTCIIFTRNLQKIPIKRRTRNGTKQSLSLFLLLAKDITEEINSICESGRPLLCVCFLLFVSCSTVGFFCLRIVYPVLTALIRYSMKKFVFVLSDFCYNSSVVGTLRSIRTVPITAA